MADQAGTQYRAYTIEIADGYEYSQYQTLRTIELYHNSKFTTGTYGRFHFSAESDVDGIHGRATATSQSLVPMASVNLREARR